MRITLAFALPLVAATTTLTSKYTSQEEYTLSSHTTTTTAWAGAQTAAAMPIPTLPVAKRHSTEVRPEVVSFVEKWAHFPRCFESYSIYIHPAQWLKRSCSPDPARATNATADHLPETGPWPTNRTDSMYPVSCEQARADVKEWDKFDDYMIKAAKLQAEEGKTLRPWHSHRRDRRKCLQPRIIFNDPLVVMDKCEARFDHDCILCEIDRTRWEDECNDAEDSIKEYRAWIEEYGDRY